MADFWGDRNYPLENPYDLECAIGYAKVLAWCSVREGNDGLRQAWQLMLLTFSILPKYVEIGIPYGAR